MNWEETKARVDQSIRDAKAVMKDGCPCGGKYLPPSSQAYVPGYRDQKAVDVYTVRCGKCGEQKTFSVELK